MSNTEVKVYDDFDTAIDAENPNGEVGKSVHFFVRDEFNPLIVTEYNLTLTRREEMSKAEWAKTAPIEIMTSAEMLERVAMMRQAQ
jgi:hypothetical protein